MRETICLGMDWMKPVDEGKYYRCQDVDTGLGLCMKLLKEINHVCFIKLPMLMLKTMFLR